MKLHQMFLCKPTKGKEKLLNEKHQPKKDELIKKRLRYKIYIPNTCVSHVVGVVWDSLTMRSRTCVDTCTTCGNCTTLTKNLIFGDLVPGEEN